MGGSDLPSFCMVHRRWTESQAGKKFGLRSFFIVMAKQISWRTKTLVDKEMNHHLLTEYAGPRPID
jgi:hypothetical protein